jgi:hypothetical protein
MILLTSSQPVCTAKHYMGGLIIFAIFGQRWLARSPLHMTKRR